MNKEKILEIWQGVVKTHPDYNKNADIDNLSADDIRTLLYFAVALIAEHETELTARNKKLHEILSKVFNAWMEDADPNECDGLVKAAEFVIEHTAEIEEPRLVSYALDASTCTVNFAGKEHCFVNEASNPKWTMEEAFEDYTKRRDVWPRLTHEEIFNAGWRYATGQEPKE